MQQGAAVLVDAEQVVGLTEAVWEVWELKLYQGILQL
jgi:hypothetical protein